MNVRQVDPRHVPATEGGSTGWAATLTCNFRRRGTRTLLAARQQRGPLLVQRPFYPEANGTCHIIILHPPGGVAAGDCLEQTMVLDRASEVLVTTPSATKFYRSAGARAEQVTHLEVGPSARLEWLPMENIMFRGAHVQLHTRIELAPTASFMGWEVTALGRTARNEHFDQGQISQRLEIYRAGQPLWFERARYRGGDPALAAAWGLGGYPVYGSLLCTCPTPQKLVQVAQSLAESTKGSSADVHVACTALPGIAVYRYLGRWSHAAHEHLRQVWELWRPIAFGAAACPPRIWQT